ncbi:hypothetical protein OsI_34985 [Oryza sativa Indica Group]|uniref:Uncharacterized protein n=1 Tax=Oryza sativa subsp. indica TaxID=39946 RepID=A2ZB43_ORYSI|nr:hypothetical protein OsI_34985 [Oryza sativa Indica Group]
MEELLGHADLDNNCLIDVLFKENLDDSSGNYAIAEKSWYLAEDKATNNQVRKW